MTSDQQPIQQQLTADEEILGCINLKDAKSFFLFAGAGSGKTHSLVLTLKGIRKNIGLDLRLSRKRVAVITYTNSASDEIKHRLDLDPLFAVSTIHHFAWELIKPYTSDIKECLREMLTEELQELEDLQSRGRAGTKAAIEREISIRQKNERLKSLNTVKGFKYSPTGDNSGRDALNHSEVIDLASIFLTKKPLLQKLLVTKYPILFIDESQDTNKNLIESLFNVQSSFPTTFTMGLFGDTMQRIYFDGKPDLGFNLPIGWIGPEKKINYRCPIRVVRLINQIRALADGRKQEPREGQDEGYARLFIVERNLMTPLAAEESVVKLMAKITKDDLWHGKNTEIKVLTLEHHMAASRMGFLDFFNALAGVGSRRTTLIDGTFPGVSFFTKIIVPLSIARANNDSFAITRLIKDNSPMLKAEYIKTFKDQREPFRKAKSSSDALFSLWENKTPTLSEIAENIYQTGLFELPQVLSLIIESQIKLRDTASSDGDEIKQNSNDETHSDDDKRDEMVAAWETALTSSFAEIEQYSKYIENSSRFGTHQGVKGREFERVMVIADDVEARGFSFSYDRIFGVKSASDSETRNLAEGRETILDRTLRLFYVACSRAEWSLAIVAYTDAPQQMKTHILNQKWFAEEEIVVLPEKGLAM